MKLSTHSRWWGRRAWLVTAASDWRSSDGVWSKVRRLARRLRLSVPPSHRPPTWPILLADECPTHRRYDTAVLCCLRHDWIPTRLIRVQRPASLHIRIQPLQQQTMDVKTSLRFYALATWQRRRRHYIFRLSRCSVWPFVRPDFVTTISHERLEQFRRDRQLIFISPTLTTWLDSGDQRSKVQVTAGINTWRRRHPRRRSGVEVDIHSSSLFMFHDFYHFLFCQHLKLKTVFV